MEADVRMVPLDSLPQFSTDSDYIIWNHFEQN